MCCSRKDPNGAWNGLYDTVSNRASFKMERLNDILKTSASEFRDKFMTRIKVEEWPELMNAEDLTKELVSIIRGKE